MRDGEWVAHGISGCDAIAVAMRDINRLAVALCLIAAVVDALDVCVRVDLGRRVGVRLVVAKRVDLALALGIVVRQRVGGAVAYSVGCRDAVAVAMRDIDRLAVALCLIAAVDDALDVCVRVDLGRRIGQRRRVSDAVCLALCLRLGDSHGRYLY
jgi:hypothetical protein